MITIVFCIIGYIAIASVAAGVWREIDEDWEAIQWFVVFWPILVMIVFGRVIARLIKKIATRPRLPRARVEKAS